MSISTFQEKFIRGGCGIAILIGCAAVMFGGMFYSCASGEARLNPDKPKSKVAMVVGGHPVTADILNLAIETQARNQMGQLGAMAASLGPKFEAGVYYRALDAFVDQVAYIELAKKNGVDLNDQTIINAFTVDFDNKIRSAREQAEMSGQLKKGATDKEFDEFVKKQTKGKSLAELKQAKLDEIKLALADPTKREDVITQFAQPALTQALLAKRLPSDAELAQSYDTITYKRILLKKEIPGKSVEDRAKDALAAVKGGLKFEDAIDRYSNDFPTPKKKLSETTNSVSGTSAATDPQFKALANLKAGEITDVVDVPEGKAILKVVSRTSNLPKDFAIKKEQYRKELGTTNVEAEIKKQIKEVKDSGKLVTFNSPGYKALYEYGQNAGQDALGMSQTSTADPIRMRMAYENAKAALQKNEGYDQKAAALAEFAAMDSLYKEPNAPVGALRENRANSIRHVLQITESVELRLDLVKLLLEDKKNEEAAQELLRAAQANGTPDQMGQDRFGKIASQLMEMKNAKQITAEQENSIITEQRRWSKEKQQADAFEAEQRRKDAEDKKKQAEEKKKFDAEAKKAAAGKAAAPKADAKAPEAKPTDAKAPAGKKP